MTKGRLTAIIVAIIATGLGVVFWVYAGAAQNPSLAAPPSIDGIQCNSIEQLSIHYHTHLDIVANGQYFLVPPQIGIIPDKCIYWLHTHDETGVIHIESPGRKDFTLGQFLDIWNKKFNNNQILNILANSNNSLNIYLNGTKLPTGTNYRDIKLTPHEEIAIVYGKPPSTIPSSYDFPVGE